MARKGIQLRTTSLRKQLRSNTMANIKETLPSNFDPADCR
jgi:hypothetical protein